MIPENINKEHIEKAIAEIDREGVRKGRHSSTYDLIHNGKFYPPKLVLSIANRFANGSELDSNDFGGGKGTPAFELMKNEGFEIISKNKEKEEYTLELLAQDLNTKGVSKKHFNIVTTAYVLKNDKEILIKKAIEKIRDVRVAIGLNAEYDSIIGRISQDCQYFPEKSFARVKEFAVSVRNNTIINYYNNSISKFPNKEKSIKIVINLLNDYVYNKNETSIESLKKQYWLYSPGNKDDCKWEVFYKDRIMGLGWDEIGDLNQYHSRNDIKKALVEAYGGQGSKKHLVSANDDFLNKINIGDVIIAKKGKDELLGYGVVTSNYEYDKSRSDYQKIRQVNWKLKGNWKVDVNLVVKTLTDITKYSSDHADYDKYYERLLGIMEENNEIKKLSDMNLSLNTILYGPPGTGKTHILKNQYMDMFTTSESDSNKRIERFEFLTFHQSYSYEDFIEGIKPELSESNISYKIEEGVFLKMCNRARNDSSNNYAIFIDEINRGNISSIFGELITLIEDDKREGKPNEIKATLPYSKKHFSVPKNLYIIGTMNTADRSVEALDTALRRRFSFIEMNPEPEKLNTDAFNCIGINLEALLSAINARIEKLLDKDYCIGHSYFMTIANRKEPLAEMKVIFQNKILPLLQEYFYGDWGKILLVIGEEFVETKKDSVKFLSTKSYEDFEEYDEKSIYNFTNPSSWTLNSFKSIYE